MKQGGVSNLQEA